MSWLAGFSVFFAAIAPFTERGQTDFDTLLDLLNPYGGWTEVQPNDWRYTAYDPKDAVPFTRGRWIYTDFGWNWSGKFPGGWATDHYGWWILDDKGVWAWHPDPLWHPAPVDFRQSKGYIGWRPSRLGLVNELLEKDEDRFARPEEWIWVPQAKFGKQIEPGDVITGAAGKALLEDSSPLTHVFTAWRQIERPGPAPETFVDADRVIPNDQLKEGESPVKSYSILSLPTFWTPAPEKAKPDDLYLYRPEIFQDMDGIERRVKKWYHPEAKAEEQAELNKVLQKMPQK